MAWSFIPVFTPLRQKLLPRQHAVDASRRPTPFPPLTRHAPRMTSTTVVVTELVTLTAATAGVFYALYRGQLAKSSTDDDGNSSTESQFTPSGAIVGLHGSNAPETAAASTSSPLPTPEASKAVPTPSPYDSDSVGVNINDFLDDRDVSGAATATDTSNTPVPDARVREELEWAVASLLDLEDCDAVAIVDTTNTIVHSGGPLITDVSDAGEVSARVVKSRATEMKNVSGNDKLPFLASTVRSYASMPVGGRGGACLMLASNRIDLLLGDKEMRVASAVCNRLASYSLRP